MRCDFYMKVFFSVLFRLLPYHHHHHDVVSRLSEFNDLKRKKISIPTKKIKTKKRFKTLKIFQNSRLYLIHFLILSLWSVKCASNPNYLLSLQHLTGYSSEIYEEILLFLVFNEEDEKKCEKLYFISGEK